MIEDRTFLTRDEAVKIDTTFYEEYEDEYIGCWAVFGVESGFMYRQFHNQEEAEEYANEMNARKAEANQGNR